LVDVLFSEHGDMEAAQAFFRSAQAVTGVTPDRVTTDGPPLASAVSGSSAFTSLPI